MLTPLLLAALNHLLDQAEWARRRLQPHAGQHARIQWPVGRVDFQITNEGQIADCATDTPPDLTLVVSAGALVALADDMDGVMRHVRIQGSAEFGEALGLVLRNLRWDAEEDLARVIGDIPARRLAQSARSVFRWQRDGALRLSENLRDYLVVEQPTLVARPELEVLIQHAALLRDDLARLEKRIARLEAKGLTP